MNKEPNGLVIMLGILFNREVVAFIIGFVSAYLIFQLAWPWYLGVLVPFLTGTIFNMLLFYFVLKPYTNEEDF